LCNGCMSFQFPISSPCPFEKDKGVGFGSFYCGLTLHELGGLCMHVFFVFWWRVKHCWKYKNDPKKDQKTLCHYNPSYLQPLSQKHVKPFANPPHLCVKFLNECCLSEWIYIIKWCSLQWSFKYFDYLVMPRGYLHLWGTYYTNYFIITDVFEYDFHKFNGMVIL
jgi:hypothetical protein